MPSWAPRPVPTSRAIGVARPSAHGQATISTAIAARSAEPAPGPHSSQPAKVSAATSRTTGTNTAATRSASRCAGALPDCAAATSRAICASCVSRPTLVARTTSRPPALTVAPTTASPGPTSTGTLSPVNRLASTALVPLWTVPSVATRSPGRTTKRSPTRSSATGTSVSTPSRSTLAEVAPNSSSARRSAPARRLARPSIRRPASWKVVSAAPTSK
jgi:hypothetical protein